MQTNISEQFLQSPEGQEADSILRSCVHCGFCTATCPTYQLLGDELDGPRGRIYLIKQMLEGQEISKQTQAHLDRCLTCRSCETTCPSGVRYHRLLDIGRAYIESRVPRNWLVKAKRLVLRKTIPYPARYRIMLKLATLFKPLLPASLKKKIPAAQTATTWPVTKHSRKMLALQGCAQSVSTPDTNSATARILNKLGIELTVAVKAGCCGAVSHHLSAEEEGLDFMRRNIDAWWPHIEAGAEAIVITASGCGAMVKEYGDLLKHDADYAEKAHRVSGLSMDISEILSLESFPADRLNRMNKRVAFHSPCTLQHGQQITGKVEAILEKAGYQLTAVADSHLCCGSAGTYSVLQPELSQQLLRNKLGALQQQTPDIIATANIGCQMHLASQADTPVRHWVELIDEAMK